MFWGLLFSGGVLVWYKTELCCFGVMVLVSWVFDLKFEFVCFALFSCFGLINVCLTWVDVWLFDAHC